MVALTIANEVISGIYGGYVAIIIYINARNIIAKMYTLNRSLLIYEECAKYRLLVLIHQSVLMRLGKQERISNKQTKAGYFYIVVLHYMLL